MCLITGLSVIVLVALFTPMRTVVAQDISTVAHAWSASFGVHSLADGPHTLCNASSGGCP
jgi:hypothetical protein